MLWGIINASLFTIACIVFVSDFHSQFKKSKRNKCLIWLNVILLASFLLRTAIDSNYGSNAGVVILVNFIAIVLYFFGNKVSSKYARVALATIPIAVNALTIGYVYFKISNDWESRSMVIVLLITVIIGAFISEKRRRPE